MPDSWLLAEESCQTGNDEQEVAGGSDQRERQVRSRKLTRLQQDPELFNPGLDERRNEQVDVGFKMWRLCSQRRTPMRYFGE